MRTKEPTMLINYSIDTTYDPFLLKIRSQRGCMTGIYIFRQPMVVPRPEAFFFLAVIACKLHIFSPLIKLKQKFVLIGSVICIVWLVRNEASYRYSLRPGLLSEYWHVGV